MRRMAFVAVAVSVVALLAASCGYGDSGTPPSSASAAPADTVSTTPPPIIARLPVALREFSVTVVRPPSMPAGRYAFDVTNEGRMVHNLTINGPGVSTQATPNLAIGQTATLTVTVQLGGQYELWCSIGAHRAQGMETTILVR
jgi:hypothetical protein